VVENRAVRRMFRPKREEEIGDQCRQHLKKKSVPSAGPVGSGTSIYPIIYTKIFIGFL
jgi:hypothetical protein